MEIPFTVTARKDTGLTNSKIGIWLFLASEVMLFGGLFSSYLFLRIYADYPWPERTLPILPGLINTFILIGSSVTVVFAWAALKMREWKKYQIYMGITLACAALFMVLKALEYNAKFHHQAVRLVGQGSVQDYAILEGHVQKGILEKDELIRAKKIDGQYPDEAFYANKIIFKASELTFIVNRPVHDAYLKSILRQAKEAGSHITLIDTIKGQTQPGSNVTTLGTAGDKLSRKLLDKAEHLFLEARGNNENVETRFLRQKWYDYRQDHPYTEENPDWKAILSPEWQEISQTLDQQMKEHLVPTTNEITFKIDPPLTLQFAPTGDIASRGTNGITLRDGTVVKGEMLPSPIFLGVDAIDFRFTAQRAKEEDIDPQAAIAQSWVLKQPKLKALWDAHQEWLAVHTAKLAKKDREPTDTEKYRVNWQEMVAYGKALEEGKNITKMAENGELAASRPGWLDGFTGADHYNPDMEKYFVKIDIPRENVGFESTFTPRWNTYYAIYFLITGLHGLHVIGGALVLGYFLFFGRKMYETRPEWLANRVEVAGLFWHFVDLVWIFLFPILYLM